MEKSGEISPTLSDYTSPESTVSVWADEKILDSSPDIEQIISDIKKINMTSDESSPSMETMKIEATPTVNKKKRKRRGLNKTKNAKPMSPKTPRNSPTLTDKITKQSKIIAKSKKETKIEQSKKMIEPEKEKNPVVHEYKLRPRAIKRKSDQKQDEPQPKKPKLEIDYKYLTRSPAEKPHRTRIQLFPPSGENKLVSEGEKTLIMQMMMDQMDKTEMLFRSLESDVYLPRSEFVKVRVPVRMRKFFFDPTTLNMVNFRTNICLEFYQIENSITLYVRT